MCRVCWVPNPNKVSEKQLAELFAYLEKEQGGSGNGYGGFVNGEPVIKKGIKLTTQKIAKEIRSIKWDNGVLFHTRIASKGSAINKNCHPFNYGEVIACHNGTLRDASQFAIQMLMDGTFTKEMKGHCKESPDSKHLPKKKSGYWSNAEFECAFCDKDLVDITDSEIITFLVGKYGIDILKTIMDGTYGTHVILIMSKDGISAYTSGSFEVLEVKKGVFVYASDFPKEMVEKSKKKDLFHAPSFDSGKLFKLEPAVTSLEELTSEVIKEPTTGARYWYGEDWYSERGSCGVTGGGNAYDSYNKRRNKPKPEKKDVDLSPDLFANIVVGNSILVEELEELMKKET